MNRLASIAYIVFGLLAGAASIYSAWVVGSQPPWARPVAIIGGLLLLLFCAVSLRAVWPCLRKTPRDITLAEAIARTGLVDIESRNEGDRHLPPEVLYQSKGIRELVITGITASSSFQNHLAQIKRLLADKNDVYFLICLEDTVGLDQMSVLELRDLRSELAQVRSVIRMEKLDKDEHFHIRAFAQLPTFTSVMVNGDIMPRHPVPNDSTGFIRVQPRRMGLTHHEGVILHFKATGQQLEGFGLFAADLRTQWNAAPPWK